MEENNNKFCHLLLVPFTGLGLYAGFRGNRWLKNRIKIFEQFVIPSLLKQTIRNFKIWVSWRSEERYNKIVKEFVERLKEIKELKFIHTYSGCPFYDDKYENEVARERLVNAIHYSMGTIIDEVGDVDYVFMTIQPSDDLYHIGAFKTIQDVLMSRDYEAIGFKNGFICNYQTKELKEYNPTTNPPFYTIKFPKKVFIDPLDHIRYTGLKMDVGKYKAGTPLPSHEYVGNCLKYAQIDFRGFLVGTHLENISTHFNNPFAGEKVDKEFLINFGIENVLPLKISYSLRKKILSKLPFPVQRKLRYWFGEKLWNRIYEKLRS